MLSMDFSTLNASKKLKMKKQNKMAASIDFGIGSHHFTEKYDSKKISPMTTARELPTVGLYPKLKNNL